MKFYQCIFLGLLCCLTLMACSKPQEQMAEGSPPISLEPAVTELPISGYTNVLENIKLKANSLSMSLNGFCGTLYDLTGDEQGELVLLYQYPEDFRAYEVWTLIDGTAVQLAAVYDMPSVAGNGFGGIYLASDSVSNYVSFWMRNNESNSSGVVMSYDFSVWKVGGTHLEYPQRFGVKFQQEDGSITDVVSSFANQQDQPITVAECQQLMNIWHYNPKALLCQEDMNAEYPGVGMDFDTLLAAVK